MNLEEVKDFGLYDSENIKSFKKFWKPESIISVIADTHIGDSHSMFPEEYLLLNKSASIKGEGIGSKIYKKWLEYSKISQCWNVDTICFLGDAISGTSSKLRKSNDIIDIDNQINLAEIIFDPYFKDRKSMWVSGTNTMHDSLDTNIHAILAERYNGIFGKEGYLYFSLYGINFLMAHKTRKGALFPLGILERNRIFTESGIQNEDLPPIDLTIGAHWHKFEEVPGDMTIGCWQGFYTIKGDFINYLCDFYNIICLRFYNTRNFVIKNKTECYFIQ